MIDFGFVLCGRLIHDYNPCRTYGSLTANRGVSGIGYFPGREGRMDVKKGRALRIQHVHVTPERLFKMVGDDIGGVPMDLRNILDGETGRAYWLRNKMDPVIQAAAQEMFSGGQDKMPRNLCLEGKALELISIQLGRLMAAKSGSVTCTNLSSSEKNRIQAARELLANDLSKPPTLNALAHHSCLSQNKLQFGFRQLFGSSVFGYFLEYKTQKARQLLIGGDMNVSQVAWEVGYTNVSQFSKAYKKRFGMLPKYFRKSVQA